MRRVLFSMLWLGLVSCSGHSKKFPLCSHFVIAKSEISDFTEVERDMVCGRADNHTPIGVFRVTGAHGIITGNRGTFGAKAPHWQFYLSYGEEF